MNITDFLPLVSLVSLILSLLGVVGGIFAFRQGFTKTLSDTQSQVITALKLQNETQATQIKQCEKEIVRLKQVVATIQHVLKRRGVHIRVHEDYVDVSDSTHQTTIAIQQSSQPPVKEEEQEDA